MQVRAINSYTVFKGVRNNKAENTQQSRTSKNTEAENTIKTGAMDALSALGANAAVGVKKARAVQEVQEQIDPAMGQIQELFDFYKRADKKMNTITQYTQEQLEQTTESAQNLFDEVIDVYEKIKKDNSDPLVKLTYKNKFWDLPPDEVMEEFDENGIATGVYTPKPSYRAFQVLASIFREEYSLTELPVRPVSERSPLLMREEDSARSLLTHGFRKPDGSCAFVYWMPSELLTTSYEATISIESCGLNENVRLIDLLDGSIYTIPENMEEKDEKGYRKFLHLPLRDYPLLLTFGKFVEETPIEQKSLARCEFKAPV